MKMSLIIAVLAILLAACNPQEPVTPPAAATPPSADKDAGASGQLSVVNWGQRSTPAGEAFNVQADGNSGISFELSQPAPPAEIGINFDGKPLTGVVVNGIIATATIPAAYIANPGKYPVVLSIPSQGMEISAGDFEVTDAK